MPKKTDTMEQATAKLYKRLGKELVRRAKEAKKTAGTRAPGSVQAAAASGAPGTGALTSWTMASARKAADLVATGDLNQINGWSWTG